jgi:integrase
LTVEEIKTVFTALDLQNEYDYIFNTALRLALELGLRRGELSGLEGENIDFENNLVHLRNNLVYPNGYVRIETTKTKESTRDIYISDDMLNLLKELKAKQENDKKDYGKSYEENKLSDNDGAIRKYNFVFRWKYGKYVHPMFYTNKIKKVLKLLELIKVLASIICGIQMLPCYSLKE